MIAIISGLTNLFRRGEVKAFNHFGWGEPSIEDYYCPIELSN